MKKELLRINRLNYNYTRTRKLENVSFCILEGECIGFLGLSYSGKDLMTSLLRGELTEGDGSGAIYLGGQKVNDWEVLGKEIYYMCPDNYVIEDWTVAEYLCLVDSGWAGSFWRKGVLNEEAGKYFEELELDFDISSRIRDLSELEKRIVDVVKAYRKGARIIIIEDEFDGVSQTDIAVMQGAPTAPNHAERYQAHLDALAKYPDIQVIDGGIDNDNVETAQSQAAAVLAANPDLTGYLNCDACGSGVAAAIEEKGMQDKVTFVAMDNLIEILDYVKTGTITATSSTLPQEQGMYAVLMAYQAAQGMPLPANVDTGIGRITADNIDEWIEIVSAK